jgi:hypothetical protein
MFDEYDEGTAILPAVALKRNLPSGGGFIALDADGDLSLPSDWYLKIAAFAAEVMRGQREVEKTLPRKMLLGDYWGSRKHGPAPSSSGGSGSTATSIPNQAKVQGQESKDVASADTDFWKDVKDIKDDEPPPPAYTLEEEERAAMANAPSAAAGGNRVSTVPTSGPTANTVPVVAPWVPPPGTHRFAPPPSAPPSHTYSPPSMRPTSTPPHSPAPYNPAISSLSNDFSRMNTGPQSTHQSEHAHSGSPPTGGWTAPVAAPASPPPGTHSLSNQYPPHGSLAPQPQQWGQPSGPPLTSSCPTATAGNPGAPSSSPYQPPSSCLGTSLQSQPAHSEHGANPSNTSSYPVVQSPWYSPQLAPPDQPGTPHGQYYTGHGGTSYPPPPGPPQPPQHPSSGPQTQPDPNYPNKRTSHNISKDPILIRFGTCADSSLYFACSHISLRPWFLLRLFAN